MFMVGGPPLKPPRPPRVFWPEKLLLYLLKPPR